jgi:glutaconyl-CoA decarboxylase
VKDKEAGKSLDSVIDKMNELAQKYRDTSQPDYSAHYGFVDEVVKLSDLRAYLKAFSGAVYQNPKSICPRHQMILPRIIRG